MERRAQQQTLSIRVSDSVREYLERVKQVMSSCRGDGVSTSEVAKMLLESAKEDRLDHRLEVANLQRNTAESLWSIRQKWEQQQGLSHAEWLFLARDAKSWPKILKALRRNHSLRSSKRF